MFQNIAFSNSIFQMLISIQKENIFQVVIKAINYNIQLIEKGLEFLNATIIVVF
jgi:hypothetical protein